MQLTKVNLILKVHLLSPLLNIQFKSKLIIKFSKVQSECELYDKVA